MAFNPQDTEEKLVPDNCKRCREPMYMKNNRCRNCGIHKDTPVMRWPRWQRRLAGEGVEDA